MSRQRAMIQIQAPQQLVPPDVRQHYCFTRQRQRMCPLPHSIDVPPYIQLSERSAVCRILVKPNANRTALCV